MCRKALDYRHLGIHISVAMVAIAKSGFRGKLTVCCEEGQESRKKGTMGKRSIVRRFKT